MGSSGISGIPSYSRTASNNLTIFRAGSSHINIILLTQIKCIPNSMNIWPGPQVHSPSHAQYKGKTAEETVVFTFD
jgi:hypothetical protein